MERIRLCGVEIDNVTGGTAVTRALLRGEEPNVVFTPNAVMLEACRHDASLAALLNHASLSLADGMGVVWAARRRKTPLRERVAGIDFAEAVLARAAKEGLRVFLLGGAEGVAETAAQRLREREPTLCICGTHWGYFDREGEENRQLLAHIRETRAEILFVCLGFPLQEKWICDNLSHLSSLCLIAGLGGSLDVWAGKSKRAPHALSRAGLEWAWRMLREPRRLRHLAALVRFSVYGASRIIPTLPDESEAGRRRISS